MMSDSLNTTALHLVNMSLLFEKHKEMKKIFIAILAASAVFAGCNKHVIEESGEMGSFSLKLSYEGEYATKADVPQVNVEEFKVKLERKADQWEKIFTYADLKKQIAENGAFQLLPGNYNITAYSPSAEPAQWEQPIFSGSASFAVKVGEVTSVTLNCTLQNMMVTIQVSDAFANELVDYDVTVTNGKGTLVWTRTEVEAGRAGFFTVAPLRIHVNGYRTATSDPAVYDGQITNVAAKDHHVIKLDAVNTGAVGGLDITVDYSTNDIYSDFEVPGNDWEPVPGDPENPDQGEGGGQEPEKPEDEIVLSWDKNPDMTPLPVEAEMDVELDLSVVKGIKDFKVIITSEDAGFLGLVSVMVSPQYVEMADGNISSVTIDMVNDVVADDETGEIAGAATFSTILSMPYGDELVGLTSMHLSMSKLVPLIQMAAAPGTQHYFTLFVSDASGAEDSWTLSFYL